MYSALVTRTERIMQERGRLDVAGLAARIILVAECITLVGGGRLDVAGGRA